MNKLITALAGLMTLSLLIAGGIWIWVSLIRWVINC